MRQRILEHNLSQFTVPRSHSKCDSLDRPLKSFCVKELANCYLLTVTNILFWWTLGYAIFFQIWLPLTAISYTIFILVILASRYEGHVENPVMRGKLDNWIEGGRVWTGTASTALQISLLVRGQVEVRVCHSDRAGDRWLLVSGGICQRDFNRCNPHNGKPIIFKSI